MARGPVRAVLFDSGGVLIGPVGGRWNPRFDFEQTVRRRSSGVTDADFTAAIAIGDRFLERADGTPSRDEYHTVMLDALGVEATADLLADPRMYHHASDALGLEPSNCLFVDDSPALVAAAIDLGYQGVALLRDGARAPDVPTIGTLRELLTMVDG